MKQLVILAMFMALSIHAQNLEAILSALKQSKHHKSLDEKARADIAQSELFGANNAPVLRTSLSYADALPSANKDGEEYSFGISQDILNPLTSSAQNHVIEETSKSILQETKHAKHLFEIQTVLAYHNACVSKEMQTMSLDLYTQQTKVYAQLQKAYKLGEISKKDLLFNKLELVKLEQHMSSAERMYTQEFSLLQDKVDNYTLDELSCDDLVDPATPVELPPLQDHGELKSLGYKTQAANALYTTYDAPISSLGYELLYEKELGTKRYTFGIHIPLSGLGAQKEKLKAQQLSLSAAYRYEADSLSLKIKNYSKFALLKLQTLRKEYTLLHTEVLPLNEELMSLSKLALLEGEGNIFEYVDATRSYTLNALEMLAMKKNYYKELFKLYTVADIEYGEKICTNY